MWNHRLLARMDWRVFPVICSLMMISLLVISATDPACQQGRISGFLTPKTVSQLQRFCVGWGVFFLFAGIDYNKIREWTWIVYLMTLLSLLGLFCVPTIHHVHRWYRLPLVGISVQPSEYAKLVVVLALSWFLERHRAQARTWRISLLGSLIVCGPFVLILKQPDLGTALVLCPIALVLFYLGDLHPLFVRIVGGIGVTFLFLVLLIFTGILSHEQMRPYALRLLKEYQYERLNPHNHHQRAALTAIGVGGVLGSGWRASEFTSRGWLPYGYTDSVFPAFGEEFGFVGLCLLLLLFYSLIYFGFQATAVAKDPFGRMLSSGITVYIAMHVLVNIGMMCGFLPVTGVPLILVSYGGSSVLVTMAALGILQSVYSRRFMF